MHLHCAYEPCPNRSSALNCFKRDNTVEIRNVCYIASIKEQMTFNSSGPSLPLDVSLADQCSGVQNSLYDLIIFFFFLADLIAHLKEATKP